MAESRIVMQHSTVLLRPFQASRAFGSGGHVKKAGLAKSKVLCQVAPAARRDVLVSTGLSLMALEVDGMPLLFGYICSVLLCHVESSGY